MSSNLETKLKCDSRALSSLSTVKLLLRRNAAWTVTASYSEFFRIRSFRRSASQVRTSSSESEALKVSGSVDEFYYLDARGLWQDLNTLWTVQLRRGGVSWDVAG